MPFLFSKFFDPKPNHNQSLVIEGYNKLLSLLKYPDYDKKAYRPMNESGVCSADSVNWVVSKLANNPKIREDYLSMRQELAKIATMKDQDINKLLSQNKKQALALLDFGDGIQRLQEGTKLASNMENKLYQKDMMSIWLYSLPLVTTSTVAKQQLANILKFDRVYRLFSKQHVFTMYTSSKDNCVYIMDSNEKDEEGEKKFDIENINGIFNYIVKRFNAIDEDFDSVEVFLPIQAAHTELKPTQFEELTTFIFGNKYSEQRTSFFDGSFVLWLNEIETFYKSTFKDKSWSSYIEEGISFIQSMNDLIRHLSNYSIIVDHNFIEEIKNNLKNLKAHVKKYAKDIDENKSKKFETDITFYETVLEKLQDRFDTTKKFELVVSIDYLIRNIQFIASEQLKYLEQYPEENKNYQVFMPEITKIISVAQSYILGSQSLEETINQLKRLLNILIKSDNYFDKIYAWPMQELQCANLNEINIKNSALAEIISHSITRKDNRNNLHAAVALSDSASTRQLLASGMYDANSKGNNDLTPLQIAIHVNNPELIKLLIANNANVNTLDGKGYTLLHYDNTLANPEIFSLILNADCEPATLYKSVKVKENCVFNAIDLIYKKMENVHDEVVVQLLEILLKVNTHRKLLNPSDQSKFVDFILKNHPSRLIDIDNVRHSL